MTTTVTFTFGKSADEPDGFSLSYELIGNDFTSRWASALQIALNRHQLFARHDDFFGSAFVDEAELRKKMSICIGIINSRRKGSIVLRPYPNMSRDFIMKLHADFERLEPHPAFSDQNSPREVKMALVSLNILIHKYETLSAPPLTHLDITYFPTHRYCFEPGDFAMYTTERKYGELYLSYAGTGVPVINAFLADYREIPVPQNLWTPSVTLGFLPMEPFDRHAELENWLQSRWAWSLSDPGMNLGFMPLGFMQPEIKIDKLLGMMKAYPKILDIKLSPTPGTDDLTRLRRFEDGMLCKRPFGPGPSQLG